MSLLYDSDYEKNSSANSSPSPVSLPLPDGSTGYWNSQGFSKHRPDSTGAFSFGSCYIQAFGCGLHLLLAIVARTGASLWCGCCVLSLDRKGKHSLCRCYL